MLRSAFNCSIHAAVHRVAEIAPRSTALSYGDTEVDFVTLCNASSVIAQQLAKWGIKRGDLVPLVMERGPQLVAVELGVLMCGAAYASIDPRWSLSRIKSIVSQLDAPTVGLSGAPEITHSFAPESLPNIAARMEEIGQFVPVEVEANDPATVFFTSGTSGASKGVVVPHRAVTRLFGPQGLQGFGIGHVTPQIAPVPWDMYAFELWGQLTTGGTVALVEEDHLMPRRLRELIANNGVDTIFLTTSLFNLFVDEDIDSFSGLERIYVGGEKQSTRHVEAFIRRYPSLSIWNAYGPAENCMLTTIHPMSPTDIKNPAGIPLGNPVPGTQVLLLDENGTRVPPGTRGEIVAVGTGVALGYLGINRIDQKSFEPILYDGQTVQSYRTGDIGVLSEKGVLTYVGRKDRQIKLNGNRIELDDIEATVARMEEIQTCAAIARRDSDGQVRSVHLICTLRPGKQITPQAVRKRLTTVLPRYAIPESCEFIDEMPLSANGKLDLNMLETRAKVT